MAKNKARRIVRYDPNTGMPIYENPSSGGRAAIKGVLIGLIVVALGVGGWFVYDTFFNMTEVDLFMYMDDLYVKGYSGDGYIEYSADDLYYEGDWIGEPGYTNQFYDGIRYTIDKTEGLSNGDVVTVTAYYDKKAARKAKVKVKSDTKQFTISGLKERFQSDLSDMSSSDLNAIKDYMNDYMDRYALDRYYNDYKIDGMVRLMFIYPSYADGWDYNDNVEAYDDKFIAIYKGSYTWFDEYETEYLILEMEYIEKGLDYSDIDSLVRDEELNVYAYAVYGDDLDEIVDSIMTKYNRETVTTLSI